jgi:predicted small lipoprotein YifL
VIRAACLMALVSLAGCPKPPGPAPMPPDASDAAPPAIIDGGTLHTYTCPVGNGGASWTCQDGLTTPVGTCAKYGCR